MADSLTLNHKPSSDHGANVIEEPGQDDLTDMDNDKADERNARDEVNRPCGLTPAKDRQ